MDIKKLMNKYSYILLSALLIYLVILAVPNIIYYKILYPEYTLQEQLYKELNKNQEKILSDLADDNITLYYDESSLTLSDSYIENNLSKNVIIDLFDQEYDLTLEFVNNVEDADYIFVDYNKADQFNNTYNTVSSSTSNVKIPMHAYSNENQYDNIVSLFKEGYTGDVVVNASIKHYLESTFDTTNVNFIETTNNNLLTELEANNNSILIVTDNNVEFKYELLKDGHSFEYDNESNGIYQSGFDSHYKMLAAKNKESLEIGSILFNYSFIDKLNSSLKEEASIIEIENIVQNNPTLNSFFSSNKTIDVTIPKNEYPYGYVDHNGNPNGIYFEYFKLLDKYEKISLNYNTVDKLDENDFASHGLIANLYLSADRTDFLFSDYSVSTSYVVISKEDELFTNFTQIDGTVSVTSYIKTIYPDLYKSLDADQVVSQNSHAHALEQLDKNEVDYAIISRDYYSIIDQKKYNLVYEISNFTASGHIGIHKDHVYATELITLVNETMPFFNLNNLLENEKQEYQTYLKSTEYLTPKIIASIVFFLLINTILITNILNSKKDNKKIKKRVDKVMNVADIGSIVFEDLNTRSDDSLIYLNKKMVNKLQIKEYSLLSSSSNNDRVLCTVKLLDFLDTIVKDSLEYKKLEIDITGKVSKNTEYEYLIKHYSNNSYNSLVFKYSLYFQHDVKTNKLSTDGIVIDVTEEHYHNKKLNKLVYNDSLTGCRNRLAIKNDFNKSVKSCIYFDIDNFKLYNDNYGHHIGDAILKKVVDSVEKVINKRGTLYRVGGDEFTIFTKLVTEKEITTLCDDIILETKKPLVLNGKEYKYSLSMGVNFITEDKSLEDFLKEADLMMILAKKNHKGNYIVVDNNKLLGIKEDIKLEAEISELSNYNDFVPYYQPKVDLSTGKCIGFEALVRWNHNERGVLTPYKFLKFVEKNGKLIDLDKHIFEESIKLLEQLLSKKIVSEDFVISTNFSQQFLTESDFKNYIINTISSSDVVDFKNIEVEILEDLIIDEHDDLIQEFKELDKLGVNISIDDFGKGYSNLAILASLPFAKIKVDKSIVDNILISSNSLIVLKSIVTIAKSLAMNILCEGVETVDQVNMLKTLGINYVQGYYFSKPMPINKAIEYLNKKDE